MVEKQKLRNKVTRNRYVELYRVISGEKSRFESCQDVAGSSDCER